ncbi:MAG: hypothetical protein OXE78_09005 [Gammaproteobacteria bacterium]|nr:hypothetical protein [Gammaproteobacteria bacterium]
MSQLILGLDVGSNSLGWGLLSTDEDGHLIEIIDAGVRIFPKAVEEKTPTPKNQKRRQKRLARRTLQRRARRKRCMLKLLVNHALLPNELLTDPQPEVILNSLGDPYLLRSKALDEDLQPHELGRVILHLVQRRGFLSNRKTRLGREMLDDPDVLAVLGEEDCADTDDAEESAFKSDINRLREDIRKSGCRTLGEYLARRKQGEAKRNRGHLNTNLRTDRQMYRDELAQIFTRQMIAHSVLTDELQLQIEQIIFHQRPIKLKEDRVGKCSLEPRKKRILVARLEYQRFRYLQDINNLRYLIPYSDEFQKLNTNDRGNLKQLFEGSS